MATLANPCCDLHFTCVNCPIITGPDCVPPNNMLPGQLWYNPCTCTFYFDCPDLDDEVNNCEGLTPLNYKPGAGIALAGDCENGHYISVKIEVGSGLGFNGNGELTIDCATLISHCDLFTKNNLVPGDGHFYLDCAPDLAGNEICTFYIDTIIQARNAGEVSSGGICVGITDPTYELVATPASAHGILVYQGRTDSIIHGTGTILPVNGGHYITETFTNPWADPAYIEVDMIVQPTAAVQVAGLLRSDKNITYVHSITEELNVAWPTTGVGNTPVSPNWCFTPIDTNAKFYSGTPGTEGTLGGYTPHTNSCKFSKLLNPGQSVTLYYQWWAIMDSTNEGSGAVEQYVLHGGMSTASKMIRHADHF